MKNIFQKKSWHTGAVQIHVYPPPIPLIKSKFDLKTEIDYVKIKLRRNPRSEKLEMYELKMPLFDNGDLEELLLFVINFKMNIEASGILTENVKLQYLCTLFHGKALHKFETLCVHIGSTAMTRLN